MKSTKLVLMCAACLALLGCSDSDGSGGGDGGTGDALDGGNGGDGDSAGGDGDGDGDSDNGGDGDGDGDGTDDRPAVNFIPMFPGAGTSDAAQPLQGGEVCDSVAGATVEAVSQVTRCFFGQEDRVNPAATIEQVLECVDGVQTIHLRLTFDPSFADNSYGDNAVGWADGHTFDELVGSDHAELLLVDGNGDVAMELKVDYISESDTAPSGYASGCVSDGGKVNEGDEAHVIECSTSLDKNLNERGYSDYLEHSPATDEDYTPSMEAPEWDYRIVYEVWVDVEAFGDAGFSGAFINQVHASPSKEDDNTIEVTPGECPPCVETPDVACDDGPPPGNDDPCLDGNPDTFCADGGAPGGDEPAFCELYPTDPACKPE